MKEIYAKIAGKVQQVGFRQYTKKQADKLGVVGWVRNLDDGTVECIGQGKEEKLEKFAKHLKRGPYFADVETTQIDWYDDLQDQFSGFTIDG